MVERRVDGPGHLQVAGADRLGHPIVQIADTDLPHTHPLRRDGVRVRTVLLEAPHRARTLNEGRVGDGGVAGPLGPLTVTDGDDVWMASNGGDLWLYDGGADLVRFDGITTSPEGAPGVVISAVCR